MTPTRYLVARVAQTFGYVRKAQRMSDAASEMHLLREAESYLGIKIWEDVKDIEALSVEYWNLRKLKQQYDENRAKVAESQSKLEAAHQERIQILEIAPEINQEIANQRAEKLASLEELAAKRDQIVAQGRNVRRLYVGLKTKLEVITEESQNTDQHKEEILAVQKRLEEIKEEFSQLKNERVKIGHEIETGDAELDAIEEKLKELNKSRRVKASSAFQLIGECNKQLTTLNAECGETEAQMHALQSEIGRYVSRNYQADAACATACSSYRALADVMQALRKSIALNLRLAGNE